MNKNEVHFAWYAHDTRIRFNIKWKEKQVNDHDIYTSKSFSFTSYSFLG